MEQVIRIPQIKFAKDKYEMVKACAELNDESLTNFIRRVVIERSREMLNQKNQDLTPAA